MANSVAIKCPNCGASSYEEARGGDRSCLYCRTTFRVSVDAPPVILKRAPYPVPPRGIPARSKRTSTGQVLQLVWVAFVVVLMILFASKFFSM